MIKKFEYKMWLILHDSPLDKDGDGLGCFITKTQNLPMAVKNMRRGMLRRLKNSLHKNLKRKLSLFFVTNNLDELEDGSLCKKTNRYWEGESHAPKWYGGIITNPKLIHEIEEINNCLLLIQDLDEATQ